MVRNRARELKESGYDVYVENQNKFVLLGSGGVTLAGTPDIVAAKGTDALVVDCKTGKERGSDVFQVLVYMLVLPKTHKACAGAEVRGQVEYRGQMLDVGADKLTEGVKRLIRDMIRTVGGSKAPTRVPSGTECLFCGLGSEDCMERVEDTGKMETPDTDGGLF